MKTLFTLLLSMFFITSSIAQDNDIDTKSVEINDLISFVVAHYEAEDIEERNITFLIQVHNDKVEGENLIMLRQAFKLISERLSEDSKLSIGTYGKFNGIALQPTLASEQKLILHTLSDLKGNIAEFYKDGIATGYQHADQNYNDMVENTVVMIRVVKKATSEVVDIDKEAKKTKKKNRNKALLTAAMALLPELIDLIKN